MSTEFNNQYKVGQGGYQVISSDSTLVITDRPRMVLVDASAGSVTLTLFSAEGLGGKEIRVMKTDSSSNVVTVAAASSQTINGVSSVQVSAQFGFVDLISNNISEWLQIGSSTGGGGAGGSGLFEQIAEVTVSTPATTVDIPFTAIDLDAIRAKIILFGMYRLSGADTVNLRFDDRNDGSYDLQGRNTNNSGTGADIGTADNDGFTTGLTMSSNETNAIECEIIGSVKIDQAQGQLQVFYKERNPLGGTFYGGGLFNTQESIVASFNIRTKNQVVNFRADSKFQVYVQKYG